MEGVIKVGLRQTRAALLTEGSRSLQPHSGVAQQNPRSPNVDA